MSSVLGIGVGVPFYQFVGGLPQENLVQWLFSDKEDSPTTTLDGETVLLDRMGDETRTVQEGRCYLFDGTDDYVTYGNVGDVTSVEMYIKFAVDNQEILTLADSTATAVTVSGGSLTFGGSLSGSNIEVDDVSKNAAEAGALLNDNTWHKLKFDLTSVTASDLMLGTDSSAYGNFSLFGLKFNGGDLLFAKCDEDVGSASYDSSGSRSHGVIKNATLSTFHASQNVYSYQNEVGYSNDTNFPGGDNQVTVADSDDFNFNGKSFSIRFKVKFDDLTVSNRRMMGHSHAVGGGEYSGFVIFHDATSKEIKFRLGQAGGLIDVAAASTATMNTDRIYDLVFVRDLSTNKMDIWFDNVRVKNEDCTLSYTESSDSFRIGGYINTQQSFPGIMKDLRIYDKALSSEEIGNLYNGTDVTDSLVASYTGGTTNADWVDNSTNSNDGTITGSLGTVYLPRDESDTDNSILAEALDYSGIVKYNAALVNSNCATFDDTDDYIETPLNFSTSSINAVECKLKYSTATSSLTFLGPGTQYGTLLYYAISTGDFKIYDGTDVDLDINYPMSNGEWYTIKFVLDNGSSQSELWINGSLIGTGTVPDRTNHTAYISYYRSGASYALSGQVYDYKIWDTSDDLLLNYHLAEGAGAIAYDVSGNDNHGTITNATLSTFWGTKQDSFHYNLLEGHSKYMNFDQTDDRVVVSNDSDFDWSSSDGSVDLNLSVTGYDNFAVIISAGGYGISQTGWGLYLNGSKIYFSNDGTVSNTELVSSFANGSYHIALIKDGATTKLFIDGSEEYSGSLTFNTPNDDLYIGGMASNNSVQGIISDVRITKGELAAADLTAVQNGTALTDTTKQKMLLQGHGNTDADWADQSGNSNDGTVGGTPSIIRIPALLDSSASAIGGAILNPSGNFHNDAETEINQPLAPALIQADIACNKEFWFNSDQTAANDVGYADIVEDVATGDEQHVILADVSVTDQKKNIVTYLVALAGGILAKAQKYLHHAIFYLLLENGSRILTESGDLIIL